MVEAWQKYVGLYGKISCLGIMHCMRILLVEDDPIIAQGLSVLLRANGYVVDHETSVAGAIVRVDVETYDCLIIDRGLPDGDGTEVITVARKKSDSTPILCLTAKHQPAAIVEGLDAGADDYLSKPFLPDVLLARLRALIRRKDRPISSSIIRVGDLVVNTNTRVVTCARNAIDLAPKEFQLLEYFLMHRGQALDRQEILDHVWGEETDMFSNTVDVHVRYLRKKIDLPNHPSFITTIRGKGYMICEE